MARAIANSAGRTLADRATPGRGRANAVRDAIARRSSGARNTDGNARLTGISASFVLTLVVFEVVTVALGVKSVITAHVAIGLVLAGPMLLKLGSVTYRMVSYYGGVREYRQRGKPAAWLRVLGGALAVLMLLLLASGLALIAGPSALHRIARSVHVASAYGAVALLVVHLVVHLTHAVQLASADARPRTPPVRGARSRWLTLSASLAIGGVLAVLLGGRGSNYIHHYYPAYSSQRPSISTLPSRTGGRSLFFVAPLPVVQILGRSQAAASRNSSSASSMSSASG
jgi:hypothetical protein